MPDGYPETASAALDLAGKYTIAEELAEEVHLVQPVVAAVHSSRLAGEEELLESSEESTGRSRPQAPWESLARLPLAGPEQERVQEALAVQWYSDKDRNHPPRHHRRIRFEPEVEVEVEGQPWERPLTAGFVAVEQVEAAERLLVHSLGAKVVASTLVHL